MYTRTLLPSIQAHLSEDEITILIGARQTGKSSLMQICIEMLQQQGKQIVFLTLEKPSIKALLDQDPENILQMLPATKEKLIVCIDEIQYLKDPTNFLKLIYDLHRDRIKLFVTGSSAFYIDRHFKDSLAGRKKIFTLYPLSFREFLVFKEQDVLLPYLRYPLALQVAQSLQALFSEYIQFGGYPRLVLENTEQKKQSYLDDLISTYIKKDILEADIKRPEIYLHLMKLLAEQTGKLMNMTELANILWISLTTVKSYLYTMQVSFHLSLCRPFSHNIRKEITKMPKVYFFDHGIRNYLLNDFRPFELRQDKGEILENEVYKQFCYQYRSDQIQFWRDKQEHEIDFVINDQYAYEVKVDKKRADKKVMQLFQTEYPKIPLSIIDLEQTIAMIF